MFLRLKTGGWRAKKPMTAEIRDILRGHGLRPPERLTVAITGVCNLKCSHCWVKAGSSSSPVHVPTETLCRIIEEFAEIGGEEVCFTGGEPLCHPDWLEFIQLAYTKGFPTVGVQTNGMLLRNEDVAALNRLNFRGLSIQISLDGATSRTHDLVRGEGAFKGALEGIQRLVKGGLGKNISISFTEMRHNLEEFPVVLELAASMGINSVTAGGLVVYGRAAEGSLVGPPRKDQYLEILHRYEAEAHFRELYDGMGNMAALEWLKEGDSPTDCCTFVQNTYVTPSGVLYPCVLCHVDEYSVSGVFEKGLAQAFVEGIPLWSGLLQISRSRVGTIEECVECAGRTACAGGCMGRSWGTYGDLLAADDRCELRRTVYDMRRPKPALFS